MYCRKKCIKYCANVNLWFYIFAQMIFARKYSINIQLCAAPTQIYYQNGRYVRYDIIPELCKRPQFRSLKHKKKKWDRVTSFLIFKF